MKMLQKMDCIEQWGLFELEFTSAAEFENPFTDAVLEVVFSNCGKTIRVRGFYDGNHVWRVRFMPERIGTCHYLVHSNLPEADAQTGHFEVIWPSAGNHGPVRARGVHFFYADETPCFVAGTTLYAWWYRPDEVCEKTLLSLKNNAFNKVRMLVFPKYLAGMSQIDLTYEPFCLPFEGKKFNFDLSRPNPLYFQKLDQRILELQSLGVEADVILLHNYDFGMWGIDDSMNDTAALRYIDYLMARISAFRNVWWSVANEYDLTKTADGQGAYSNLRRRDWDDIGRHIMRCDPYHHLRSIHNCGPVYPERDWLTHVSYQFPDAYGLLMQLQASYRIPVINDEYQYEGNLTYTWGNLSAEQGTFRHWLSFMAGGYATHGECYVVNGNKRDIYWTYGGDMTGGSAKRISYLAELARGIPFELMEPDLALGDGNRYYCLRKGYDLLFFLYAFDCPEKDRRVGLGLTDGIPRRYKITVYDLWEMNTISEEIIEIASFAKIPVPKDGLIGVKLECLP